MIMNKKIIRISHTPLYTRSRRLSYADAFLSHGYIFEYWDMTDYFHLTTINVDGAENANFVKKIDSIKKVKEALNNLDCKNSIFFIGIPERWEHREFYKLLTQYQCRLVRVNPCANTLRIAKSPNDIISFLCSPSRILAYIKRFLFKIYCNKNNIRYYDVFSSSKEEFRTKSINHPDYDEYIFTLKNLKDDEIKGGYAVFYDSYFPLHPDFTYIHKLRIKVDYKHYLKSMNRFFDYIERQYNLKVVIAAHPSSKYNDCDFNGRRIIKWHTCALTINAQIIINQSSNSTSFAALANKPILFITNDDIEQCRYMSRYISTLSNFLGKKKYNIDNCDYDKIPISKIKEPFRDRYINTFLTDKSTYKSTNAEIFSEYVDNEMNEVE